jgi:hypothetical protein
MKYTDRCAFISSMPLTPSTTERDEAMFRAHLAGDSLRTIAGTSDLSHESVRIAIVREGRRVIDQLHLDLIASHGSGDLPTLVIPDHAGPDHDLALAFLEFVINGLARLGMRVRTIYRPTYNGVVIALIDADPPKNSKAAATKESA